MSDAHITSSKTHSRAQRIVPRTISHDPRLYPDPEVFSPERYFMPDGSWDKRVQDPANFVFGFGRRYVSERMITCAMLNSP